MAHNAGLMDFHTYAALQNQAEAVHRPPAERSKKACDACHRSKASAHFG
jgi:hypothetical protein